MNILLIQHGYGLHLLRTKDTKGYPNWRANLRFVRFVIQNFNNRMSRSFAGRNIVHAEYKMPLNKKSTPCKFGVSLSLLCVCLATVAGSLSISINLRMILDSLKWDASETSVNNAKVTQNKHRFFFYYLRILCQSKSMRELSWCLMAPKLSSATPNRPKSTEQYSQQFRIFIVLCVRRMSVVK